MSIRCFFNLHDWQLYIVDVEVGTESGIVHISRGVRRCSRCDASRLYRKRGLDEADLAEVAWSDGTSSVLPPIRWRGDSHRQIASSTEAKRDAGRSG